MISSSSVFRQNNQKSSSEPLPIYAACIVSSIMDTQLHDCQYKYSAGCCGAIRENYLIFSSNRCDGIL